MRKGSPPAVVVADDDVDQLQALTLHFTEWGYSVFQAPNREKLLAILQSQRIDFVLLDVNFGRCNGLELISEVMAHDHKLPVVMLTAYGSIQDAIRAVQFGAKDYLTKPTDLHQLRRLTSQSIRRYRLQRQAQAATMDTHVRALLGESPQIRHVRRLIREVAPTDAPVLITGESGTGKELAARAIHARSQRCRGPFVPVNMAALPAGLAESELFGHERGAFTGALANRVGWCEQADGGTLFLDEVAETELSLQAKLLRFLQDHEFQRVGASQRRHADVRIVSATNRDAKKLVDEMQLREDLYYRLNVIPIEIAPLRERLEDIPLLATAFLEQSNSRFEKTVQGFDEKVLQAFCDHPWQGNVRELENLVQRLVILTTKSLIDERDLPKEFGTTSKSSGSRRHASKEARTMNEIEREAIEEALARTNGNAVAAAGLLGMGQATIYRKVKRYGIVLPKPSKETRSSSALD